MKNITFWNDSYIRGFEYRQISDSDVDIILSKADKPKTVLDIGCGTGQLAHQFYNAGLKVTAIDISDIAIGKAVKMSPPDIDFRVMNIEADDIDSLGQFDLVSMKLVFAFMVDKGAVIQKIKHLLRPGGYLLIINPVVTKDPAPPRVRGISVDDDITMCITNFGFSLKLKTSIPLSEYHQLVTYIFRAS